MSNTLEAFLAIAQNPIIELTDFYKGRNRVNNVGKALEVFIEDAFANTINNKNEQVRQRIISEIYSYSGNQNNPPDLMLKNSDAIEVKKIQSPNSGLALNSSYPKAKLYANSPMLTEICRKCEDWAEKDIIYVVGHTSARNLKSLWMVYGDCYAADKSIYERIKTTISSGIVNIPDVEFTETNELGKVKRVDPLGITDLRIRGMWSIVNPRKVFDYLYKSGSNNCFELVTIMKKDKYMSFPKNSRNKIEKSDLLQVKDVQIKDPNNPANLIDGKLLTFTLKDG